MSKKNNQELLVTNTSQKVKEKVIARTNKELKGTYKDISNLIKNELKNQTENTFNETELKKLEKKINSNFKLNAKEIKSIIENAIIEIVDETIENNLEYYKEIDKKYGSDLNPFLAVKYKVIKDIVIKAVIDGEMYKDNLSLSDRIWKDLKKNQLSIDAIIKQGLKDKEHPLNIAKKLEQYVNPYIKKDFNWSQVYPGSKAKVEYNAIRLARTSINHAHHQAVINMAKNNPLVTEIEWLSSNSHGKTCSLCASRDGKVYPINKVPQDHPNGMCLLLEVQPDDETFERLMDKFMESDYDDFMDFMEDYNLDS